MAWSVKSLKEVFGVWTLDRLVYIRKMNRRRKTPKEESGVVWVAGGKAGGLRHGMGLSRSSSIQQIHVRQMLEHQVNSS